MCCSSIGELADCVHVGSLINNDWLYIRSETRALRGCCVGLNFAVGQNSVVNDLSGCFPRQILTRDISSQFVETCTSNMVLIISCIKAQSWAELILSRFYSNCILVPVFCNKPPLMNMSVVSWYEVHLNDPGGRMFKEGWIKAECRVLNLLPGGDSKNLLLWAKYVRSYFLITLCYHSTGLVTSAGWTTPIEGFMIYTWTLDV